MGELRFELHCEWSVTCVWIMEGMVWENVWKGYEVKGVDGGGGHQNERIRVETSR